MEQNLTIADVTSPAQALEVIEGLAEKFNLSGAGYLTIEDLKETLEELKKSYGQDWPYSFNEEQVEELYQLVSKDWGGGYFGDLQCEDLEEVLRTRLPDLVEKSSFRGEYGFPTLVSLTPQGLILAFA